MENIERSFVGVKRKCSEAKGQPLVGVLKVEGVLIVSEGLYEEGVEPKVFGFMLRASVINERVIIGFVHREVGLGGIFRGIHVNWVVWHNRSLEVVGVDKIFLNKRSWKRVYVSESVSKNVFSKVFRGEVRGRFGVVTRVVKGIFKGVFVRECVFETLKAYSVVRVDEVYVEDFLASDTDGLCHSEGAKVL